MAAGNEQSLPVVVALGSVDPAWRTHRHPQEITYDQLR